MESRGLLITGTDTGVGKTFVACGLAAALQRRRLRVAPFKPAETGCELDPQTQRLIPADAELLRRASGTEAPLETICPYRFRAPVAPWVAAELEGCSIEPQRIEQCYRELASSHDIVLVETAGGLLVPLTAQFHYGDLARLLHLPVLLVAGSKLGVINQTLLTLEYLRNAGLRVAGCILNHPSADSDVAIQTNREALRRLIRERLYVVQHFPDDLPPWKLAEFDELASGVSGLIASRSELL